ncbi:MULTISPECIES: DUF1214 domain-containing protein [Dyella]|uniref:DUF1254 domain-containing protein n=2 Tax=Dyella TaxID=231454 RepID=A0A4R0YNF6_9GAMM|nr:MULTISPECIES: DUF1214 domain-containing protein [Dyella]TBR36092.1 DUF1254 domain-containing protein [Dyella terrae]TCI06141.1 DUF1254 domain-containing protein [Dyella soli]
MATRTWLFGLLAAAAISSTSAAAAPQISDDDISNSYIYLLGRLLILNQEQADFAHGFKWNTLIHRKPGDVAWPNPNLDVAYSEAWVAIDDDSCVIVTVPKIKDRYYTVQFLNGWGETVANINERVYPQHPDGEFGVCLKDSKVKLPDGAQRVDVPAKTLRVLSRVELGANAKEAEALQKKFTLRPTGNPPPPKIAKTPMFDIGKLPGVEAFDAANLALDSEADINPGMDKLQADTRAVAKDIKDPEFRRRVANIIQNKALTKIASSLTNVAGGTVKNGWALPATSGSYGNNYLLRTIINLGGIWANTPEEVIYYKAFADEHGKPLNGDDTYVLHFTKDQLPADNATYFWSVIAVDTIHRRVLPNPLKRYLINNVSKLTYGADGSLTLYFGKVKPKEAPDGNWLPTPKGTGYSLTFRFYRPKGEVAARTYFPPGMSKSDATP